MRCGHVNMYEQSRIQIWFLQKMCILGVFLDTVWRDQIERSAGYIAMYVADVAGLFLVDLGMGSHRGVPRSHPGTDTKQWENIINFLGFPFMDEQFRKMSDKKLVYFLVNLVGTTIHLANCLDSELGNLLPY